MRYAYRAFSLPLAALLLFGCASRDVSDTHKFLEEHRRLQAAEPKYVGHYDVSLIEVQRPTDAQGQFGELKISSLDTSERKTFRAEDALIAIIWNGPGAQLVFDLLNKGESPAKVIWDEAAYVDITGLTHRVIHSGVKLADRNTPLPPSVIPSKGRLNDLVYPSDLVRYSGSRYGVGWVQPPMFPCMPGMVCQQDHREHMAAHTGLNYRVLLPIQVGKDTYPYTFVFQVNKAETMAIKGTDNGSK